MEKVKIKGRLKVYKKHYFKNEEVIRNIDKEGWLKDKVLFYPDKDNAREYYQIVKEIADWSPKTILVEKLDFITKAKKPKSTCKACKPQSTEPKPQVVEETVSGYEEVSGNVGEVAHIEVEKLSDMEKKELMTYAKDIGLKIHHKTSKDKIIKLIKKKYNE